LLVHDTVPPVGAVHVTQDGPQLFVSVSCAHMDVVPHWCSPVWHWTPHCMPLHVAMPPPVTAGHALAHVPQC
jgi:hypothetical protein